jgi:hypothetical protein
MSSRPRGHQDPRYGAQAPRSADGLSPTERVRLRSAPGPYSGSSAAYTTEAPGAVYAAPPPTSYGAGYADTSDPRDLAPTDTLSDVDAAAVAAASSPGLLDLVADNPVPSAVVAAALAYAGWRLWS